MAADGIQAVMVGSDPVSSLHHRAIMALAAEHRLPAYYFWPSQAAEGGFIAYGPDIDDLFRRAAGFVVKLLRGAPPAEVPIEQAQRFQLVVNLTTAKLLGLTIPEPLLVRADRVIE
jgi:putative ABC transport system substrate-binding protein